MLRITDVILKTDHSADEIGTAALKRLRIPKKRLLSTRIIKRSYDARNKENILFVYTLDVEIENEKEILDKIKTYKKISIAPVTEYKFKTKANSQNFKRPVVIGSGPCGLFCALILAQAGFRPIIIERGKSVKERSADTFGFWRDGHFDPASNVQFGEGGAGTFSDGKLNTQIRDPENYRIKVLNELASAGAPDEIRFVSKPHIGTFRLVKVVENIRNRIIELGGEYLFETKVTDLMSENSAVTGLVLSNGDTVGTDNAVLAIGHSARDTFEMLLNRGVTMEPKPFSVGFRIEHPQELIDRARLGKYAGDDRFGAADYKLVHHCSNGRSVYTFCMCPGGRVVAATSEDGCVVTNGMSQYQRNDVNANSAVVVGVEPSDFPSGILGGVEFQRDIERKTFLLGGGGYKAPAQLVGDFLKGVPSASQGTVKPSYQPGVKWTELSSLLPQFAIKAIREAIPEFAKQVKGFDVNDAVLTGSETRTSSPVRIVRGDDFQSVSVRGLFPGGEGAGYAGGIMSAAIDGIKIAEVVSLRIASGDR
ncbi:MAG: hypothetical protein RBS89_05555 [Candidatus Delongbacteria bacterium]|jgi:uncharacterized FAD-dependent dehydrogenase|nr:hypothetical protein [Candidatus Delongbacteria bacterium]